MQFLVLQKERVNTWVVSYNEMTWVQDLETEARHIVPLQNMFQNEI